MAKDTKLIKAANFKDFDWNKAKLFYHVAKCGSFTKAARLAGTDRTGLNRQIQMLEKQLGYTLLARKKGSGTILLTRKGEELLEAVGPFFLKMKGMCGHHYVEINGEIKRKIKIVMPQAIVSYVLGDLLLAYYKYNPHIMLEIIGHDGDIDIMLNDADIVIRTFIPKANYVEQEYLYTLEKRLFASDEYIKKFGEPKSAKDLSDHKLIVGSLNPEDYPYADIHWILKLGKENGEKHTPALLTSSIQNLVSAATDGLGIIASYTNFTIIKNPNLINILPSIVDNSIKHYFIYPNYLKNDPDIISLKDFLQKNTL